MPTVSALQHQVGEWAIRKGWDAENIPEKLMLMVTELAEAMEEYRKGVAVTAVYYERNEENGAIKPEGIGVELADVVIRILQFCAWHRVPLEELIVEKMAYNETRPYKHGGKLA